MDVPASTEFHSIRSLSSSTRSTTHGTFQEKEKAHKDHGRNVWIPELHSFVAGIAALPCAMQGRCEGPV